MKEMNLVRAAKGGKSKRGGTKTTEGGGSCGFSKKFPIAQRAMRVEFQCKQTITMKEMEECEEQKREILQNGFGNKHDTQRSEELKPATAFLAT